MSAARQFIADVTRIGASLRCDGDRLRLVPPPGRVIPPDIIERGRALKPALLELLRESSGQVGQTAEELKVAFEERSAIAEHDGGLARTEADLLAAACVVPLREGETLEAREATIIHFASHLDRLRRRRVLPAREPGDAA